MQIRPTSCRSRRDIPFWADSSGSCQMAGAVRLTVRPHWFVFRCRHCAGLVDQAGASHRLPDGKPRTVKRSDSTGLPGHMCSLRSCKRSGTRPQHWAVQSRLSDARPSTLARAVVVARSVWGEPHCLGSSGSWDGGRSFQSPFLADSPVFGPYLTSYWFGVSRSRIHRSHGTSLHIFTPPQVGSRGNRRRGGHPRGVL